MTSERLGVFLSLIVAALMMSLGVVAAIGFYWASQIDTYQKAVSKLEADVRHAHELRYKDQEEFENERTGHALKIYEMQQSCLKGEK